MTEETSHRDVRTRLLRRIDDMNLEGEERALMWAILTAAKDLVHVVEVPEGPGTHFKNEFATAFSEGPVDHAPGGAPVHFAVAGMIVR